MREIAFGGGEDGGSAATAGRGGHEEHGLGGPKFGFHAGGPIEDVFEGGGVAAIVFGKGEDDAVAALDFGEEILGLLRDARGFLEVL